MTHDELTRLARAAFGPEPLAGLHMALAPDAPESVIDALRPVIEDCLVGRRVVPPWMEAALPEALAEAVDGLRSRLAALEAIMPTPDVPSWLGDVNAPDWDAGGRVGNWREEISDRMRAEWKRLTPRQRAILAYEAEERATRDDPRD